MTKAHRPFALILSAGAIASLAGVARAQTIIRHWNAPGGGNYQSQGNWLETTFPGSSEVAAFDIISTYTVFTTLGAVNAGVAVSGGFPSFNLSNGPLTVNGGGYSIGTLASTARSALIGGTMTAVSTTVGQIGGGSGRLDVSNGAMLDVNGPLVIGQAGGGELFVTDANVDAADVFFAQSSSSVANVEVSGAASINAGADMTVGGSGDATVAVRNGAVVSAPGMFVGRSQGSDSTLLATGVASRVLTGGELVIGDGGKGAMTLSALGEATTGQGTLAVQSGSVGVATLTGPGTTWTMNGALQIGLRGQGSMSILNSADASSVAAGFLGVFTGGDGTVTVDGVGSTLTLGGQFQVGREGPGLLTIQNGGMVSNSAAGSASGTAAILGLQGAGNGHVVVTGAGSTWTNQTGSIAVGWSAVGLLEILSGGSVTSAAGFLGRQPGSAGTAVVDGANSRWTTSGQVRIGVDPNGQVGGAGSLTVSNDGLVQASAVVVGAPGTLRGNGNVTATSVDNAGIVAPGTTTPGTLTLSGVYNQSLGGKLLIDIDAMGADKLMAQGAVSLQGSLMITVPAGFAPAAGTAYTIVQGASRAGTFSSVSTTPMPGGRTFSIAYNPASVVLTVMIAGGCPGDANGDGRVDFVDLNIVLSQFGQMSAGLTGDLNDDGRVDFVDLNIVLSGYGETC